MTTTGIPTSAAVRTLAERHRAVLPAWVAPSYEEPIELVSGSGRHVRASNGTVYLDFFAGVLTNMVGYAIPEIVDALEQRLRGGMLHSSTAYLIGPSVELAERIVALSGIPDAKAYFTNSGTEAVDAALLVATEHRKSGQVLALRNSYHGRSFATVSVTGNRAWRPTQRSGLAVTFLPGYMRDHTTRGLSDAAFIEHTMDETRRVLDSATSGDIAVLVAEPMQGVGGFTEPPTGWFAALMDLLEPYGVLLHADETQTGWGRTGDTFWGIEHEGVRPDIMTFAKGLGNGLAIGGFVGRADVVDSLQAQSTSTFGGNHLATTGALAVLDYIAAHDLQANAKRLGDRMKAQIVEGTADLPAVVDVRGRGLMIGIELADPETGLPAPALAAAVHEAAKRRGLLIGRGGLYASSLRIGPPLTLTALEAEDGTARLLDAITEAVASR
jgi:4-aminobutyrate aminotransferase